MKNKKKKNRYASLLLVLLCCLAFPLPAAAAEAPYQTYTYDKWNNTTPAPNGYLPIRSITGTELGCGDFYKASDLFYCEARGEIYVVDAGNARIVVLDEALQVKKIWDSLQNEDGSEYIFSNPQGIFVLADGTAYIAEKGNGEVVQCSSEGKVLRILGAPESTLLPDTFTYLPHKIVVDDNGRIYVLSEGIYQGLIYLEADGTFIKFFGANNTEMTWKRQVLKIWKSILSDKAASTMQSFNPIEYGNIFWSEDGYIYATAAGSETGSTLVTRLNLLGIDTMPNKVTGAMLYSDITVDENGIMTFLDSNYGCIYQRDENGQFMFVFGGIGNQVGLFQEPVSLIEVKEKLYVLDAYKNTITEFELTQFGKIVREAITLYNKGLYEESIAPWEQVIQRNSNYLLAYTGLGKAYYQLEDYDLAMYYYRLANDRSNYSDAFKEASLEKIRDSFGGIVLVAVILLAAGIVLRIYRRKRKGASV